MFRLSAASRLALGLAGLACLLLLLFAYLLASRGGADATLTARQQWADTVLTASLALRAEGGADAVQGFYQALLARTPGLRSLGLRDVDGRLEANAGEHVRHWLQPAGGRSTRHYLIAAPPRAGEVRLEVAFSRSAPAAGPGAWEAGWVVLAALPVFVLLWLLLRGLTHALAPSTQVPDRVRHAFNCLSEGVLLLDAHGRVVMVNDALRQLHPAKLLLGREARLESIPRLSAALPPESRPGCAGLGAPGGRAPVHLSLPLPGGAERHLLMRTAPVPGPRGRVEGCLVTFSDETALRHANQRLESALAALEASRRALEAHAAAMEELATHDFLTGSLTRRAFEALAEPLWSAPLVPGQEAALLMLDVDEFKAFNDRHGHLVGDQALQQVARTIQSSLRVQDRVCRFGGEEFCVLLPDTGLAQAEEIAERVRARVEAETGPGVRRVAGLSITVSIGVAAREAGESLEQTMDRADRALYRAKRGGRNRVRR